MSGPSNYRTRTRDEWQTLAAEWQVDSISARLDEIDATWAMRIVLAQIYRTAGYKHALATLKGWQGED